MWLLSLPLPRPRPLSLQYLCPSGRFGSTPQLNNSLCSGACRKGYECPAGSSRDDVLVCSPGYFCGGGPKAPCPRGRYRCVSKLYLLLFLHPLGPLPLSGCPLAPSFWPLPLWSSIPSLAVVEVATIPCLPIVSPLWGCLLLLHVASVCVYPAPFSLQRSGGHGGRAVVCELPSKHLQQPAGRFGCIHLHSLPPLGAQHPRCHGVLAGCAVRDRVQPSTSGARVQCGGRGDRGIHLPHQRPRRVARGSRHLLAQHWWCRGVLARCGHHAANSCGGYQRGDSE
jgi:hypothetical protein